MPAPLTTTARWIAGLLLAGWTNAQATTFCVSTGTQLANALASAATNGQNDEVRITNGILTGSTEPFSNARWRFLPAASDEATTLGLSGGWSTGNNCASQSIGTLLTQLDAEFQGPNLLFAPLTPSYSGQVSIRNLTLSRGRTFNSFGASGIQWNVTGTIATQLLVENVIVTAGQSSVQGARSVSISQQGGGFIRFRNNVVSNNTATGASSSAAVSINATSNAIAFVSNNSIFANQGTSQVGFGLGLEGVITASNNAVADNTSSFVGSTIQVFSAAGGGITLRNNHFEMVQITNGAFFEQGTSTGDPQWTGVGMVRLPNDVSPLRDSGVNNPSGGIASTDIEGNPRIINSLVDRGASEAEAVPVVLPDLIFQNGFDN
ncbi:MAG: hypothetical protein AB7I68_14825 [Porticoccaceae bacterium]